MSNRKKPLLAGVIGGLAVAGGLAVGMAGDDGACKVNQVALELGKSKNVICLEDSQYRFIKKELQKEFRNGGKGYDFEYDNIPLLQAVLNNEIEKRGGLEIEGEVTRDKLRTVLIDLLNLP